eukprot:4684082-Alexandrium_andersonii.AAC.1
MAPLSVAISAAAAAARAICTAAGSIAAIAAAACAALPRVTAALTRGAGKRTPAPCCLPGFLLKCQARLL